MRKNNSLNHKSRKRIYEFIMNNPGVHSRELSRQMQLPYSTVKYHINYLEKLGVVKTQREGSYHHYFTSTTVGSKEKKILSILRKETAREILLLLLVQMRGSQVDISKNLEKHPTTVEFYLKKLLDLDIITPVVVTNGQIFNEVNQKIIEWIPVGNERIYMLKNPEDIYFILKKHQTTLFDDELSNLMIYLIDYFILIGIPQRIPTPKSSFDSVLETLFEMLPLPYQV